jgi:hypothetical protein
MTQFVETVKGIGTDKEDKYVFGLPKMSFTFIG